MDISAATWLVVGLALLCANLPFANQRLLLLIPFASRKKPGWLQVLELFIYYGLVGVAAHFLEASNSSVADALAVAIPYLRCANMLDASSNGRSAGQ